MKIRLGNLIGAPEAATDLAEVGMSGSDVGAGEAAPVTSGFRRWFLFLVFLLMTSNYLDRSIMPILTQPIKESFRLSDFQVGLLGGTAFALFFMIAGVPVARMADRTNRVNIVAASMALWSAMTALTSLAGNYAQLFLCRIGVGIGETGAAPPSLSLICDYFPKHKRASAMAIHSLGISVGTFGGSALGGLLGQSLGWRAAFAIVGVPGLFVALLFKATIPEPKRGLQETVAVKRKLETAEAPSFVNGALQLLRRPTFTWVLLAMALINLGQNGVAAFRAAYLLRRFDVSLAQVGLATGVIVGVGTAVGAVFGGYMSEHLARRDGRWYVWIGAIGLSLAAPLYALVPLQPTWQATVLMVGPASAACQLFVAPGLALTQNLAEPRVRATAAALATLATISGALFGPPLAGLASDAFAADALGPHLGGFAAACAGGAAPQGAAGALASACRSASATGLSHSSVLFALCFLLAAIVLVIASRTTRRDISNVEAGL